MLEKSFTDCYAIASMTLSNTAAQNRARSRLQKKRAALPPVEEPSNPRRYRLHGSSRDVLHSLELTTRKLVLVFLFGISVLTIAPLLTTVSPSKVADVLLPQTYLPLLLLVGVMTFSLSYFFLHLRYAVYATLLVVCVVFTRVHSVRLPLSYIIVPLLLLTVFEATILLVKKR